MIYFTALIGEKNCHIKNEVAGSDETHLQNSYPVYHFGDMDPG